jgi:hypothetical protein
MNKDQSPARPRTFVVAVNFLVLFAGCATWPLPNAKVAPAPVQNTTNAVSAEPSPERNESAELPAAVAEFLERTRDYDIASAPKSAPPESRPVVFAPANTSTLGTPSRSTPAYKAVPEPVAPTAIANTQLTLTEEPITARPPPALPVVRAVFIRTPEEEPVIPAEPAVAVATNQPLDTRPSERQATWDSLLARLAERVAQEKNFAAEWELRLVELALNREDSSQWVSQHLPAETRAILEPLFEAIVGIRRMLRHSEPVEDDLLERVDRLRTVLADRAAPVVSHIALCRRVINFGVFEEMSAEDLVAGRTLQTIVYSEIRNVRAEPAEDGQSRSLLSARLELLTADGQTVWQKDEPEIKDLCRKRRRDFFIAQRVTWPATLRPGDYVLKVAVEDKLSGQAGEGTFAFTLKDPMPIARSASRIPGS